MALNEKQRALARHALGFPNSKKMSYRNHFCAGPGHDDYAEWKQMVKNGDAVELPGSELSGGDSIFKMTFPGALEARDPLEHISQEDAKAMR